MKKKCYLLIIQNNNNNNNKRKKNIRKEWEAYPVFSSSCSSSWTNI